MRGKIGLFLALGVTGAILTGCQSTSAPEVTDDDTEVVLTDEQRLAIAQQERDEQDTLNKSEDGEFYVPLPLIETIEDVDQTTPRVEARALYVTGNIAGFSFNEQDIDLYSKYILYKSGQSDEAVSDSQLGDVNRLEEILAICKATEINSLVIDVKNDDGLVKWNSDVEAVNNVASDANAPFKDYEPLLNYLKANDIYPIARIVAFKDPFFAEAKPQHTIQLAAGGVYRDRAGISWVNPYDTYIWDYLVSISKEAALRGFEEIQYDYVRFPANAASYNPIVAFENQNDRTKDEAIEDFLEFANSELEDYNVNIAVDVFAQATQSWDDHPEDIGQTWRKMANLSDAICPMIYPSHYGPGVYGFNVPDAHPYEVMHNAIGEALERNSAQENPANIRAWIQGFTASWVSGHIDYNAQNIAKQISAIRDYGINEYIIWDSQNTYDPMIFYSSDQNSATLPNSEEDVRERSPEQALERYLKALRYGKTSHLYLLTPRADRVASYDDFTAAFEESGVIVNSYTINSINQVDNTAGKYHYQASVDLNFNNNNGNVVIKNMTVDIIMEDGVFKISDLGLDQITPEDYPLGLAPNEMGQIMILMYHNVGDEEDTWIRTPENLKKDLQTLYDQGYRPISLEDYATGNITTPQGYTPVVITIDDTNENNFRYLDNGEIDPTCFVGVLVDFHESHPDFPLEATFFSDGPSAFGSSANEEKMVNDLLALGLDIGNHTLEHKSLKEMSASQLQEAIGARKVELESLINDSSYVVNTLSIPYGQRPSDDALDTYLMDGTYGGEAYHNVIALNVGWNPAPSPYSESFDPTNIPRIRASEMNVDNVGMYNYISYFQNHPEKRFISDGVS